MASSAFSLNFWLSSAWICARGETCLGRTLQFGAAEHEVADRIAVRLALFGVERRRIDRLVLGVEPFVRTQPGPEGGDASGIASL